MNWLFAWKNSYLYTTHLLLIPPYWQDVIYVYYFTRSNMFCVLVSRMIPGGIGLILLHNRASASNLEGRGGWWFLVARYQNHCVRDKVDRFSKFKSESDLNVLVYAKCCTVMVNEKCILTSTMPTLTVAESLGTCVLRMGDHRFHVYVRRNFGVSPSNC